MPTLQGSSAAAIAYQIGSSSLTLRGRPFTPRSNRIAVLGAGLMGPGIAQVFAEAGFEVDLCEISQVAVGRGMNSLRGSLDLKVELGLLTEADAAAVLMRVTPHTNSDSVIQQPALIIKVATEYCDGKKDIYDRVMQLSDTDTVIWSNTSTLNVFDPAEPAFLDRFLVAYWFAPLHILPLVEVVQHGVAHQSLHDESVTILRALGKAPVVLDKFIPGFIIINRLLRALGREAFDMVEAGVVPIASMNVEVRTSLAPRMQVLDLHAALRFHRHQPELAQPERPRHRRRASYHVAGTSA